MVDINTTRPIDSEELLRKTRYSIVVPASLASQTSPTSNCEDCYLGQVFSNKLQLFMIDYSLKVSSKNPITDKP
jgi:hypothetical protein